MALLHRAELRPTKLELLAGWLPAQPWFPAPADASQPLERAAAFRFDDPAGEVGIETLLVRTGDAPLLQVPLTYRAAPFADAESWLIGTMQHSVLGLRWVYDACGDPVYASALAATILSGGTEAEQYYEVDAGDARVRREVKADTTHVKGSGSARDSATAGADAWSNLDAGTSGAVTAIRAADATLSVFRVPGVVPGAATTHTLNLTGTWAGQESPMLLASLSARA